MYVAVFKCTQHISFLIIYYVASIFDFDYRSSSGHYTRTWMNTETKYHKVGGLPHPPFSLIKNVYTVCKGVSYSRHRDIFKKNCTTVYKNIQYRKFI
jgi:hypothetical protein